MFSAQRSSPVTRTGSRSAGSAPSRERRRPPRPCRSSSRPSPRVGLIEMPPVSNVMPLPTSTDVRQPCAPRGAAGAYVELDEPRRRAEPGPTASMPPKPSAASCRSSRTRDASDRASGDRGRPGRPATRRLGRRRGVGQVAGQPYGAPPWRRVERAPRGVRRAGERRPVTAVPGPVAAPAEARTRPSRGPRRRRGRAGADRPRSAARRRDQAPSPRAARRSGRARAGASAAAASPTPTSSTGSADGRSRRAGCPTRGSVGDGARRGPGRRCRPRRGRARRRQSGPCRRSLSGPSQRPRRPATAAPSSGARGAATTDAGPRGRRQPGSGAQDRQRIAAPGPCGRRPGTVRSRGRSAGPVGRRRQTRSADGASGRHRARSASSGVSSTTSRPPPSSGTRITMPRPSLVTSSGPSPVRGFMAAMRFPFLLSHIRDPHASRVGSCGSIIPYAESSLDTRGRTTRRRPCTGRQTAARARTLGAVRPLRRPPARPRGHGARGGARPPARRPLGIAAPAVRTAVSRMVRQGWLTPVALPRGPGTR